MSILGHLGNYNTSSTRTHVRFQFSTHAAAGANVAPSTAFEAADIRIYRAAESAAFSATQRSSANGITMTSPFDTLTGVHDVDIDLTDNTDAGFYASGYLYSVVLAPDETIDSQTITGIVLCTFEIGVPAVNVTQFGGTAGTFASGIPAVKLADAVTHGGTTALLRLGSSSSTPAFYATNSGGPAVTFEASGLSGTYGLYCAGGTNVAGVQFVGGSGNGAGLSINGGGSSSGLIVTGGSTGSGATFQAGGTSGAGAVFLARGDFNGMYIRSGLAATTAAGLLIQGGGSGSGIDSQGGATGHGIKAIGGATSGNGLDLSATDGDGIQAVGGGTGFDIDADIHGTLDTLTTYTGNTPQTGDTYALASGANGFANIKSETASIKAKTDNLPSDPADASDIAAAFAALNDLDAAAVQTAAAAALTAYDPPTNAEMEARTLVAADYATAASITALNDVSTADVTTSVTTALTTALTEGYRATNATGSVRDILYEVLSVLTQASITTTTLTSYKIDGTTVAKTYTLNSATTPTSITETT